MSRDSMIPAFLCGNGVFTAFYCGKYAIQNWQAVIH